MNNKYDIFLDSKEQPDFKNYILFGEEKEIDVLPNFNTINILVGSNNSGKSRFMRTLMKQQEIKGANNFKFFEKQIILFNEIVNSLKIRWKLNRNMYANPEQRQFFDKYSSIDLYLINFEISQYFTQNVVQTFEINQQNFKTIHELQSKSLEKYYYYLNEGIQTDISLDENFSTQLEVACRINEKLVNSYTTKTLGTNRNYFIPTLRTAHSLFESTNPSNKSYKKYQKDIFLETVLKNYELEDFVVDEKYNPNSKLPKKIFLFTGLQLYNEIVNARNGTKEERKRFDDFEKFIGNQFFNASIDIVAKFNYNEKHENKDDKETINIRIGEASRNLHDLGDGIQALIILMYSIFMAPDDTIIFIDEPELNLHPGMQRLFLDQITNNKVLTDKNLTYVIATHSNHLLDLTIEKKDISIYSFSKNENDNCVIKNLVVGDNELLRELGVNNSSVFLANCSLWVEGVSDRNYLKAFLIAYCNANKGKSMPKEDIDFAFLEYAGSNLSHYDFNREDKENINAYALNNRILILADNDDGKEEKHNQLKKFAALNKDNLLYETTKPYREIENLLSEDVWESVLIDFCKKTKTRNSEVKDFLKTEIVEKIKKGKLKDFNKEFIGKYLVALNIKELNTVYEGGEADPKSLKSKYKKELSELVLEKSINGELKWEHFAKNKKVISLIKNIYTFITRK